MRNLLDEIRRTLPLYAPEAHLCRKQCVGCPKKLMEYIETEYETWHQALEEGDTPTLGDIAKLAKTSKKILAALIKNGY